MECPQSLKEFLRAEIIIVFFYQGQEAQILKSFGRSRRVSGSGTAILPWAPRSTRRAKRAPRSAPEGRIGLQDGPRAFQDAEDGPKTAQKATKTTQEGSKRIPQKAPRGKASMFLLRCFTGCVLAFFLVANDQKRTRRPQRSLKTAKEAVKGAPGRLRGPQECPKGPQTAEDGLKSARRTARRAETLTRILSPPPQENP